MSELYNTAAEVVAKAFRGLAATPSSVAARAGLGTHEIVDFLNRFDPAVARRIAPPLGLDPEALASCADPFFPPDLPAEIQRIQLPFEDETVNVWSILGNSSRLIIDAGFGRDDLARHLPDEQALEVLITHPHRDHIGGIGALRKSLSSLRGPTDLQGATVVGPGAAFDALGMHVKVVDLVGHHPNAVGYVIHGFAVPVIAVGDAVFARSIGGCPNPDAYHSARSTLTRALQNLPGETLLLTGHGPATTLARERVENPFLAAWLSAADVGP